MFAATKYKVLGWGDPIGHGVTRPRYVQVSGVAKTDSVKEPNVVVAELIAARLGQAILLPIPPAFIVAGEDQYWFASLDFNLAGETLPPVRAAEVVAKFPEISAGIVVFDAWIMNQDRHRRNLGHDTATHNLQVFDHSRALMRRDSQRDFANSQRNKLGIGRQHCLAPQVVDELHFAQWIDRINLIPVYYLREVLKDAVDVGLHPDNVTFFLELLLERRKLLPQLLNDNRNHFPALQPALGGPQAWS